jgi:nucleotide-binding universal stress UspA family protein
VVIWVTEGTWVSCVDAARTLVPASADVVLLHVTGDEVAAAAHGAFGALMGRGHPERDPGPRVGALAAGAAADLLDAAVRRLGRDTSDVTVIERSGRVEREVVRAAEGAELLVVARDGDRSRLGPHSLGHTTRFVVDHAPCPVLLVWPEPAPGIASIPAPPPHQHPPPPHPPPHPHRRD